MAPNLVVFCNAVNVMKYILNVRCLIILFLFCLCITPYAYTQEINWSTSYPKITTAEPIVVLGDDALFDVLFTPLNADISSANVEVKLPLQMEYVSASNIGTGASAGITFTTVVSGNAATGQTVKITITSDGNKLIQNRLVEIRLNVKAQCGASSVLDPTFTTNIFSGSTLVTSGSKNYQTTIQVPTITLTSTNPNISYSFQAEVKTFSVNLAASDGEAYSVKVIFKTGINATLDNFKIDGVSLTHSLASTGTEKTYTLTLTSAELGGKLGGTAREITFDASSTRCGPDDNTIYTSTQYSAESNCVTYTGVTLTMVYPDVPGLPFMEHVNTQYVDDADAVINITDVNIDGITSTKAKSVYQNTGSADAYDIVMTARCYGKYAYIDTANMYYQVEGQATKIKIPAGSVRVNSRLGSGNQQTGYYPSAVQAKPYSITISIDDIVPIGSTISVWFPTISGSIFENGDNNIYWDYGTYEFLGISTNVTGVKNRCSAEGPTNSTSIRLYYVGCPHFRQLPIQQIYKSESSYTESIFIATNLVKPETTIEVFVKLPSWLNLDGSEPITWTYDKNSGTKRPPLSSVTNHGGGVYSIRYEGYSRVESYLNFNFKADPCGASVNLTDTIAYWFNHEYPNGKLEHVSQVFQPVAFECLLEGVTLDDFRSTRTTKGLKDSDNNSIPDDGTIAPDNEIRHDIYMQNDEGFLSWEGTVVGNDHYKYLYIPLTSVGFTYSELSSANLALSGNYSIEVIRGGATNTYPVDFIYVDNNNGYFRYNTGANSLENGDIVKIRAPFRISKGADNYTSVETEFFVSVNPISDPMNSDSDPNRFGKDRASTQLGSYTTDYRQLWNTGSSETFSNNTLQALRTGYFDIFHSGKIVAPYFENEVRRHLYPYKIIMDIPEGYLIDDPLTLENTRQLDSHNKISLNINKALESTISNIVFNTYELFDLTYDGSGTVDPSKWMLPDDIWNYVPTTRVRATRGARLGNSNMTRTVIFKSPITGEEISNSINVTFTYTGIATTLNVSTQEITAYGPTVIIPSVAVGNPSTINIKDIWVYVKGNIENLVFKDHDTNITSNGVGVEGRWFKVSGDFAPGASSQYEMSFTYKGNNDCSGDTMYVYTAAGFESNWTPNINQEFDVTDYDHLGAYRRIVILSSPAKISGSVNTNVSVLNEGVSYTLSASISTASSPGALKDPEMILTLPAGQQYIPGTAVIEYPTGTQISVPSSIEAALIATNGSLSSSRTFIFSLKEVLGADEVLMAGYLAPNVTNDEMYATLKADFVPTCETNLSGTRYSGILSGKTSCGQTAEDSGTTVLGSIIYPSVTSNYQFSVGINTKSGNRAFNEIRTIDSLIVIINKIVGNVDNMSANDSLEIILPESVNINGLITYAGDNSMSSASGTAVVGGNIISGTTRSIYISLP